MTARFRTSAPILATKYLDADSQSQRSEMKEIEMKTTTLFVLTACAAACSYGNNDPASESTGVARATVGRHTAKFWFSVENSTRAFSWGEGFPSQRQYACMVKVSLKGQDYKFGSTKWNPPPDKEWPGSKGEGSLGSLLKRTEKPWSKHHEKKDH